MADLLKLSLSLRPDRIIVGEIRDSNAAWQFLNAIRKGHKGSFSTIHAGSCDEALDNLFMMVQEQINNAMVSKIAQWITKLIDVVVWLDNRKIIEIKTVESFRDKEMTKLTFQGMANVSKFCTIYVWCEKSPTKPFELAGGETYDLPWIQTMNAHNAFLLTPTAF
jgi:Flp pilus assembly protein, ATPase CpaF